MARGKQLDILTIYKIMVSHALTDNYSETSRQLRIPIKTVEETVKKNIDKDEFAKLRKHKKEEFADKCTGIIDKLLKALDKKADNMLIGDEAAAILNNTKLNEISTTIGTLYDKRALSQGESTANVTFKMPDGVKKYAE